MTPRCGLPECSSACHDPERVGAYCAPLRCYCGGCPAAEPLPERAARPVTPEQLAARTAAARAAARAAIRGAA